MQNHILSTHIIIKLIQIVVWHLNRFDLNLENCLI